MGLIRSANTVLTVYDDAKLTPYLWSIVKEIIKTAIENDQNLIVEGCYIPFDWAKDFDNEYLKQIRYYCLVMTEKYIEKHFDDIQKFENIIENRGEDMDFTKENIIRDNAYYLEMCKKHRCRCILIDEKYELDIEL